MKLSRRQVLGTTLGAVFFGNAVQAARMDEISPLIGPFVVDKGHPFFAKVVLVDKWYNKVHLAFAWNAKTDMAGVYVPVASKGHNRIAVDGNGKVVRAIVHMPGCKLQWRDTGHEVSLDEIRTGKRDGLRPRKGSRIDSQS